MKPAKPKKRKRKKKREGCEQDDYRGMNSNAENASELTYNRRLRAGFRLMRGFTDWSE